MYVNFSIPPSLVITQVKKSLKITYSSISPYSQHFIFSLLPTFSPRFLPPPYSLPAPSFCQLKENKSDPRNNDPLFNEPQFKRNSFCYVAILVSKRFLLLFPRGERERERERLSRRETPEKWLGDELLSFKTLRFLFSRK